MNTVLESNSVMAKVEQALLAYEIPVFKPRPEVLVTLSLRILQDRFFSVFAAPRRYKKGAVLILEDSYRFRMEEVELKERVRHLNTLKLRWGDGKNDWFQCFFYWPRGGYVNMAVSVDLDQNDLDQYEKCEAKIQKVLEFIRQNWPPRSES